MKAANKNIGELSLRNLQHVCFVGLVKIQLALLQREGLIIRHHGASPAVGVDHFPRGVAFHAILEFVAEFKIKQGVDCRQRDRLRQRVLAHCQCCFLHDCPFIIQHFLVHRVQIFASFV